MEASSSLEQHRHPCDEFTWAVHKCHRKYGKQGEDCVREELSQKKCFSQLLCRNEARRFYDERSVPHKNTAVKWRTFLRGDVSERRSGIIDEEESDYGLGTGHVVKSKVSCATLLEVFAKPENEILIPEGIERDDRMHCRKIAHELASCLSTKRKATTSF